MYLDMREALMRILKRALGLMILFLMTIGLGIKVYAQEDPNKITRRTFTNYSISSLTIGSSINEIEPGSFNNLHFLSNISVDEGNTKFSSFNGCLYDKERTTLICFPQGLSSSYIPKTCVKLAPGCLAGKSASLRRQVKEVITVNNEGVYPEDYPGYDIDRDDEYDRYADPTIPATLKKKTRINSDGEDNKKDS